MQIIVGTSPVLVDTTTDYPDLGAAGQTVLVQNLGPGVIYANFGTTVTTSTGLRLSADGDAYEFQRAQGQQLYLVASEASTDVRVLVVG